MRPPGTIRVPAVGRGSLVPESTSPIREPADPPESPVPGRGRPLVEIPLKHLRASLLLKACAVAAFMGYGGLLALLIARKLPFDTAGFIALLSLASWFFLFWWLPVIERTRIFAGRERGGIPAVLETFAVSCVVLVHVLMAIIVVYAARN